MMRAVAIFREQRKSVGALRSEKLEREMKIGMWGCRMKIQIEYEELAGPIKPRESRD